MMRNAMNAYKTSGGASGNSFTKPSTMPYSAQRNFQQRTSNSEVRAQRNGATESGFYVGNFQMGE